MRWGLFSYSILLLLACAPAVAQQEISPDVRRFANVVDWSLQTGKAKTDLIEVIHNRAQRLKLSDANRDALLNQVPAILLAFKLEKAHEWSGLSDRAIVAQQSESLRLFSSVIEESNSFREALRQHLPNEQQLAWVKESRDANKKRLRDYQAKKELTRIKRQVASSKDLAPTQRAQTLSLLNTQLLRDKERRKAYQPRMETRIQQWLESARRTLKLSFELKRVELHQLCDLSAKQSRYLELAMKGILTRRFGAINGQLQALKNTEATDESLRKIQKEIESIDSLEPSTHEIRLWDKAVSRTLTPSQKAKYESGNSTKAQRSKKQ